MAKKPTIFFDMDGTLIDSMMYWRSLKWRICDNYYARTKDRINLSEKEAVKLESLSLKGAINYINHRHHTSINFKEDCLNCLHNFYLTKCKIKPDVLPFLEECKKNNIKMAVLTATPKKIATDALKHLGLIDYFDFILSPDVVKGGKYHRYFFIVACFLSRTLPKNCILIDDARYAHKTAKRLGIKTVGVYDEFRKDKLDDICDLSFENFAEIKDYFKEF